MVGSQAFAGQQRHVAEAQRQALERRLAAALRLRAIPQFDAPGFDLQPPAAGAGTVAEQGRRGLGGATPDQVAGTNAGHVSGRAMPVDRRGAQHQVAQARLAGRRVEGVERGGAEEVEAVLHGQRQGFQGRRATAGIALQQAVEHLLVEGQAAGQVARRSGSGQALRTADVDRAHRQGQVAGAEAHLVVEAEAVVGGGGNGAFGIQLGLAAAPRQAAADQDAARPGDRPAGRLRRQHVDPAIGHDQQAAVVRVVEVAVAAVVGGCALPERIDARALLYVDGAGDAPGNHQHFGGLQVRATLEHDAGAPGITEQQLVATLPVHPLPGMADAQAAGTQGVELRRGNGGFAGTRCGGRVVAVDHQGVAEQHRGDAAVALVRRFVQQHALHAEAGPRGVVMAQVQGQALGIDGQRGTRDTQACGIVEQELAETGFVVLRVPTQGVGTGQYQVLRQGIAQPAAGDRALAGQAP